MRHGTLASELLRALRGRRSQAQLSRRLGYRSNIVQRWETQRCWPSAVQFLVVAERTGKSPAASYRVFLGAEPAFLGAARAA
ncbi:MAG TPA: DUF4423 domain-containing protein, partial [Polyangiaceae bacterium]|nr:DUF4423 domain-containing protein [Polyangiaceae bacterium]